MPPPCTSDWAAVKATAIALNSIKEAASLHNVPYAAAKMRASREEWPVGRRLGQVVERAKEAEQAQLAKISPRSVTAVTSTSDALLRSVQSGANTSILSLKEKREYLASVVRTPVGDVTERSHLAQKVKRHTRRDKDGGQFTTEEVELPGKLRALELDAKLAGEMDSPVPLINLNLWGSGSMMDG